MRRSPNLTTKMVAVKEEKVRIPFGAKELDAVVSVPEAARARTALVLTHGAGSNMNFAHVRELARAAAAAGVLSLRFTCKSLNFAYRARAYRAAVDYLKSLDRFAPSNVFLGGRSMGARAAVTVCREMCDEEMYGVVRGVVCLSFPLHPPRQAHAHVKRSEDLRALSHIPVLFASGTADAMCERKLLEGVMKQMKSPSSVHWVEGANHGLVVKGRTEESILDEVNTHIISWILQHV